MTSQQQQQQNHNHQPWVEKYRPKNLNTISHQKEIVHTLQNVIETGNLPHLLLYGPPGSGKTSVALALCRQLWNPNQYKRRVLELNASDERGISIVRDKIKHFASLSVGNTNNNTHQNNNDNDDQEQNSNGNNNRNNNKTVKPVSFFNKSTTTKDNDTIKNHGNENDNNNNHTTTTNDDDEYNNNNNNKKKYPNPPFKIIILDEADTVTPDAQAALRRIIEANSRVTRFILICNYVTRIIEPLASRCAKFRFQTLPSISMKERLIEICTLEQCSSQVISYIDDVLLYSDGDMRRAITTMQSVHSIVSGSASIKSSSSSNNIMSSSVIAEIVGVPPIEIINQLWDTCTKPSSTYDIMNHGVEHIIASGFSAQLILSALLSRILSLPESTPSQVESMDDDDNNKIKILDELSIAQIAIRIAEAEKNMIDGADEYLQLMTVCSLIFTCYNQ